MGGGAIGSVGRPIIMVHVRGDDEDGGGNPCKITKADDEEQGVEKHIWDVGDTDGRRGDEGIWNTDSGNTHQLQTEYFGSVGDYKTDT